MPRSKRDEMKRSIGQAVNHIAAAILDIHEVYKQFDEASKSNTPNPDDGSESGGNPISPTHKDYAKHLEMCMINLATNREAVLAFARQAWDIDEEQLIRYT